MMYMRDATLRGYLFRQVPRHTKGISEIADKQMTEEKAEYIVEEVAEETAGQTR